uniref:WD repeat domain 70 n=1 Tax=Urocitellus parryii TaxID=9999 RepID=A0A8D2HVZ4_UROPR
HSEARLPPRLQAECGTGVGCGCRTFLCAACHGALGAQRSDRLRRVGTRPRAGSYHGLHGVRSCLQPYVYYLLVNTDQQIGKKARTFDLEAMFEQTRRTAVERSRKTLAEPVFGRLGQRWLSELFTPLTVDPDSIEN